ncbi:MAG: hypothetical protein ABI045_06095 [Flavobacteriales bacterium]
MAIWPNWNTNVYRSIIVDETNDINYFRGNVYKKHVFKYGLPERFTNEPEYNILARWA